MLRLILLTLAGLFGVLALFGTPELAGSGPLASANRAPVAGHNAEHVIRATTRPAEGTHTDPVPADDLVRAAMATGIATGKPGFDGPPLKPSPEHAAHTAAAVVLPGAAGASLTVAGNSVNLRSGPAADAAVVTALGRGAVVRALGPTTGPWIEVEDAGGNRGFVSARYLSPAQPG